MSNVKDWITHSYPEMKAKFEVKAEHLVNMMIGWVGNLGDVKVYDYEPTTKANATARNFRGVKK